MRTVEEHRRSVHIPLEFEDSLEDDVTAILWS
jgi:hypothetical protein